MRSAWVGAVVAAFLSLGCGSSDDAASPAGAASAGGSSGTAGSSSVGGGAGISGSGGTGGSAGGEIYAASACGACVLDACGSATQRCQAEPACAPYLDCVDACAPDTTGAPDAACVAACPREGGKSALDARAILDACLVKSAPSCPSCKPKAVEGAPSSRIIGQTCPASPSTKPCDVCEDERCCDTYAAYLTVPSAKMLNECAKSCATMTGSAFEQCLLGCYSQYPDAAPVYAERIACVNSYCSDGTCQAATACNGCLYEKCRVEQADCEGDVACNSIEYCVQAACPGAFTEECLQGCLPKYPAGIVRYNTAYACSVDKCAAECG
jgi:hypothetical protein